MGVYYYILNRTIKEASDISSGRKWIEFNLTDVVEEIIKENPGWSQDDDIWCIGDNDDSVKYCPCRSGHLTKKECHEALQYKEV